MTEAAAQESPHPLGKWLCPVIGLTAAPGLNDRAIFFAAHRFSMAGCSAHGLDALVDLVISMEGATGHSGDRKKFGMIISNLLSGPEWEQVKSEAANIYSLRSLIVHGKGDVLDRQLAAHFGGSPQHALARTRALASSVWQVLLQSRLREAQAAPPRPG